MAVVAGMPIARKSRWRARFSGSRSYTQNSIARAGVLLSCALHAAAELESAAVLRLLLDHPRIDVNVKTAENKTPLHIAALWGNEDALGLLVEQGANLNARNYRGQTPLHVLAARRAHLRRGEGYGMVTVRGAVVSLDVVGLR